MLLTFRSRLIHSHVDVTFEGERLQNWPYARHLRPFSREETSSWKTGVTGALGFCCLTRRTVPILTPSETSKWILGTYLNLIPHETQ